MQRDGRLVAGLPAQPYSVPLVCPLLHLLIPVLLAHLGARSIPRLVALVYSLLLATSTGCTGHILTLEQQEGPGEVLHQSSISLQRDPWRGPRCPHSRDDHGMMEHPSQR